MAVTSNVVLAFVCMSCARLAYRDRKTRRTQQRALVSCETGPMDGPSHGLSCSLGRTLVRESSTGLLGLCVTVKGLSDSFKLRH